MSCGANRITDIEPQEKDVSSFLNQVSHDIGIEAAQVESFDTTVDATGNETEYEISLRLNATEAAQFNNLFSDLFL
jgi:hypothetical protein